MSEWLIAVVLGVVEGITECLPVSSTGHLLIAERWLGQKSDLFNTVIQIGAIIAIVPAFRERIASVLSRSAEGKAYAGKVALAFFITAVFGLIIKKLGVELPETVLPVAIALIVGGCAFVVVERVVRGRTLQSEVTWAMAAGVGAAQLIAAVFPGASRSGTTILVMLIMGLARPAAVEFSFLVGIPTIVAASGYSVLKAFRAGDVQEDWGMIAVATAVGGLCAFFVMQWFVRFVKTHTFAWFGVYRTALGIVLLVLAEP